MRYIKTKYIFLSKYMNIKHLFLFIACLPFMQKVHSQIIIDEVVVVIGEEMIKESDIQNQIVQLQKEGEKNIQTCKILEDLLFQKLLFNQAKIDSVEVDDAEVDAEIERRINIFTGQEGGLEKLESFYDKTELEIKTEWRPLVREQIMAQRMQNSVVGNVEVTPNEVRTFFTKFSTDSLPTIPIQYEYAQIVIQPEMSSKEEQEIKQKLEEIRQRAIKGESFDKLAVLHSDDMESAKMGGLLGDYMSRGELVPEFSAVAFRLKEGEISKIVKTSFGYHIIQMVEMKGEKAKIKHILMRPRISPESLKNARNKADSIYVALQDSLSFKQAALRYSSDEKTKNNGGVFINPYTGTSKFEAEAIEPMILHTIKNMKPGEISEAFLSYNDIGAQVYKIIMLLSVIPEHTANIQQDYDYIKMVALQDKKEKAMKLWVTKNIQSTYVKFMTESYSDCIFIYDGWFK